MSGHEFELIFKYFDKNNDGFVSTSEMIRSIRGEMNSARQAVVQKAWAKLAPSGSVSISDLASAYNFRSSASF